MIPGGRRGAPVVTSNVTVTSAGPYAILARAVDEAGVRALSATVRHLLDTDPELASTVCDVVPAARSLLVSLHPLPAARTTRHRVATALAATVPQAPDSAWNTPGNRHTVRLPVRYDGPDLHDIADQCGVDVPHLVRAHTHTEFTVAFCGFAPGFGYLTGWPRHLQVPRRDTPRTAVPAGAVALGGEYCGVYPRSSPGGWQVLGHTDVVVFDPDRDPPALLQPGVRVRFHELPA